MNNDKMREAFEKKMRKHWPTMNTSGSWSIDGKYYYADKSLQDAWQGFQYGFVAAHSKAEPSAQVPEGWKQQLIRAYTDGYGMGHHDTVEGQYTDIHYSDRETYFEDTIDDWLVDNPAPSIAMEGL